MFRGITPLYHNISLVANSNYTTLYSTYFVNSINVWMYAQLKSVNKTNSMQDGILILNMHEK